MFYQYDWKNTTINQFDDTQLKAAYTSLWDYSGTSVVKNLNGLSYGTTNTSMIGLALQCYTASKGVNISYNNYTCPTFSTISTAIKAKQPVSLNVFYTKPNGQVEGHTVFVQGIMSGTSGGKYYNFVVMYDGRTVLNILIIVPSTLKNYSATTFSKKI